MYSSRATPGTGIPVTITQITARLRPWPLATMALQLSNREVRSLRTPLLCRARAPLTPV